MGSFDFRRSIKTASAAGIVLVSILGLAFAAAPHETVPVALGGGRIVDIDVNALSRLPPANQGRVESGAAVAAKGAIIGWYDNGHNYNAEHMRAKSVTLGSVDPGPGARMATWPDDRQADDRRSPLPTDVFRVLDAFFRGGVGRFPCRSVSRAQAQNSPSRDPKNEGREQGKLGDRDD